MRPDEARSLGSLLGGLGEDITGHVEQMHHAISRRGFATPGAAPVRTIHDTIAKGVYTAVRSAVGAGARAVGTAASTLLPEGGEEWSTTPGGNQTLAIINGVLGDDPAVADGPLSITMALREGGRDIPLTTADLRASYPDAGPRIAVFIHGLCESEGAWWRHAQRHHGDPTVNYGTRLQTDAGYLPLYIRFNSGRHISDNGRDLNDLLERLVAAWPVAIDDLTVIGHSMGGLIARSAIRQASLDDADWTDRVRHVIGLGVPNLGAPLEKTTNVGTWLLTRFAESRAIGEILNRRSVGIKDLRHGSLVEEEWRDIDPDAIRSAGRQDIALREGVVFHAIGATLAADPTSVLGTLAGDLLVRTTSASGRPRRGTGIAFTGTDEIGGIGHLDLLNHPRVYDLIAAVLSGRPAMEDTGGSHD